MATGIAMMTMMATFLCSERCTVKSERKKRERGSANSTVETIVQANGSGEKSSALRVQGKRSGK